MLEKCYIAAKLDSLSQYYKLQTIPLFSSIILQVKDTDINGSAN